MSVTNRLVFDPTDSDSVAASSSIGSYTRAGDDGALIGSQTANSENWLNTTSILYQSDGTTPVDNNNPLSVTLDSTTVSVGFAAFNTIENIATPVSTTAIAIAAVQSGRQELWLANEGNKSLYWGKTGVTAANGFPLHPGMQHQARIGDAAGAQVIGGSGASAEDLRTMQLAA